MLEDKTLEVKSLDEETFNGIAKEDDDPTLTVDELVARFALIQNISKEEAREQVGANTTEEVLKKIQEKTIEKINSTRVPMNRAQKRALKKKVGAKKYAEMVAEGGDVVGAVSETAKKLNYIDLIQKLRKLNEKKENEENGETTTEDD
jgi:cytidylate kinase